MSTHSVLSHLPLRAARWSATHPWRAIGAWFAFVAVAVALAALVPTQQTTDADYRLGESGRADAMVAAGHFPGGQVESVLVTAARRRRPRPRRRQAGGRPAARRGPPAWPASRGCRRRSGTPRTTPPSSTSTSQDSVDDPATVQAVTAAVARDHPGLDLREAGDVSVNDAINDPVAEDLHSAEGISLPDHPPADAAGLRCPDRGRRPGPARGHLRGRHHGHRRTAVAPDPRRAHRDQHDRADRDGGRRRLLAVLPQARARGAGQGPHAPWTPSRSPRPPRATRSWCRARP